MNLWTRFKRWCRGVPQEPKQELPGQRYFAIKGWAYLWDTTEPMYVRATPKDGLLTSVKVTTEELIRAGLPISRRLEHREWTYLEPFDRIAEISWDTFKTMRKLGD